MSSTSINPLFSLVEAAQLLVGHQHHEKASTRSTAEDKQAPSTQVIVSDDDLTIESKMTALRDNHLMALRAAATSAGLEPPSVQQTATQSAQVARRVTMALGDSSVVGKEIFPMKLHALLADPAVRDVISWLPQGKSFVVLRPDVFAASVLPRYFAPEGSNSLNARPATGKDGTVKKAQGVHKYPSFTRKLNRWGFRQISRGPDAGAFCHELFQRDDPELCRGMVCQKSRKSKQAVLESRQSGANTSDIPSDLISLSSVSTKSTSASGDKVINCSAAVTVSTAGRSTSSSSMRSLPFKKRRSFETMDGSVSVDIPSVVSHRNSSRKNNTFPALNLSEMASKSRNTAHVMTEVVAKEALAKHFHEQHTRFALSALMENSRQAMEAAGLPVSGNHRTEAPSQVVVARTPTIKAGSTSAASKQQSSPILGATVDSTVLAITVPQILSLEQKNSCHASATAAKDALLKAYMQALNSTSR